MVELSDKLFGDIVKSIEFADELTPELLNRINLRMCRWGYAFIKPDSRVSYNDVEHLVRTAIAMNLRDESQRQVKGEDCEGEITTNGKHYAMGMFGGREYEARLDVGSFPGKVHLSFLVTEKIREYLN